MGAKVKPAPKSQTVQLTAEDVQLLHVLRSELLESPSDLLRWALRFYALNAPTQIVPADVQKALRSQFGLLPIGPFRFAPADQVEE